MAVPTSTDARLFYRCAFQRFEEAEVLFRADFTTGAVYLAGYGVECMLKTLILMAVSPADRVATLHLFRGGRAHDFEWLRGVYMTNGGGRLSREITRHFTFVNDWSTDLRYSPRPIRADDAKAFMASAAAIIRWADGRL
jgi:HEPN domain-containing protein